MFRSNIPPVDLPDGWSARQLRDVATIHGGGRLGLTKADYVDKGITAFSAAGPDGFVAQEEGAEPSIILSSIGARCGKSFLTDGPWATLANTQVITPNREVADAGYLIGLLDNEGYWNRSGSAQPFIKPSDVKGAWVPVPPLDEQRRIAEVLRSVGESIAAAENVAAQACSTLDALLFDYFSLGGSHSSASSLGLLSDLIVVQSGFAFKSEEYQKHGHFLMRISNVQDGQISLEKPKFVKLDKKTQAFELQNGDILTSLTGNIGRVARVTADHLPAALNQRVARIQPKAGVSIDADYLFFALKSPLFKTGLAEESGGAAQQNVSPKAIGRVEIPLPSMEEQRSIGQLLSAADAAIVQSKLALEHLQNVQVSLMSDLLSGSVRVPK
jgi:type I restriction enzyme S subunit